MLELTYKHARTGKRTVIKQAVRITRPGPCEASLVCRVGCFGPHCF
jgi:hypothetical protein